VKAHTNLGELINDLEKLKQDAEAAKEYLDYAIYRINILMRHHFDNIERDVEILNKNQLIGEI